MSRNQHSHRVGRFSRPVVWRRRMNRWPVLLIALALLAACTMGQATPVLAPTPTTPSAPGLKEVLADPGRYLGQEVTVEGVLQAEGSGVQDHFLLGGADGSRLEVSPWAPLEVVHPPDGGPAPPTMQTYVGRPLRLTGTLEKRGEGFLLVVSRVEELE